MVNSGLAGKHFIVHRNNSYFKVESREVKNFFVRRTKNVALPEFVRVLVLSESFRH